MTTALLMVSLLAVMAAVSPDAARESTMPVTMAHSLATIEGTPLVAIPQQGRSTPMLPESAVLVLVGSSLLGLAALVRRTM